MENFLNNVIFCELPHELFGIYFYSGLGKGNYYALADWSKQNSKWQEAIINRLNQRFEDYSQNNKWITLSNLEIMTGEIDLAETNYWQQRVIARKAVPLLTTASQNRQAHFDRYYRRDGPVCRECLGQLEELEGRSEMQYNVY